MTPCTVERARLIADGADLMQRTAAVGAELSARVADLSITALAACGHRAAHLAIIGTLLGQCLSWLADDRQAGRAAALMDLGHGLRDLCRQTGIAVDRSPAPGDLATLRRDVEAYHARVLALVCGDAVLPFRQRRH